MLLGSRRLHLNFRRRPRNFGSPFEDLAARSKSAVADEQSGPDNDKYCEHRGERPDDPDVAPDVGRGVFVLGEEPERAVDGRRTRNAAGDGAALVRKIGVALQTVRRHQPERTRFRRKSSAHGSARHEISR